MRISELSRQSSVSVHRLRRYEALGLLQAQRSAAGYREFSTAAVREAIFISMSRELGFSLARVAEVLPRYRARTLSLDELRSVMEERITEVDAAIEAQRALRRRLVSHLGWIDQREKKAKARKATAVRPSFPGSPPRRRR